MDIQRIRNMTTGQQHFGDISTVQQDLSDLIGIPVSFSIQVPLILSAIEPILRVRLTDDRFWDGQLDRTHVGDHPMPVFSDLERDEALERYRKLPPLERPATLKNTLINDIQLYLRGDYYGGFHYKECLPVLITLLYEHGNVEFESIDQEAEDAQEQINRQVLRLRAEVAKTLLSMYTLVNPNDQISNLDLFQITLGYRNMPPGFTVASMDSTSFEENAFFFTLIEAIKSIPVPSDVVADEYISMQVGSVVAPYEQERQMFEKLQIAQMAMANSTDNELFEANAEGSVDLVHTVVSEPQATSTLVPDEVSTQQ